MNSDLSHTTLLHRLSDLPSKDKTPSSSSLHIQTTSFSGSGILFLEANNLNGNLNVRVFLLKDVRLSLLWLFGRRYVISST